MQLAVILCQQTHSLYVILGRSLIEFAVEEDVVVVVVVVV